MEALRLENELPARWPENGAVSRRPPWWSLVAIVGVIAVVLALLFPAFFAQGGPPGPPGPTGPTAACRSQVSQLGLGEIMYSTDNDDLFPTRKWMDAIYPYTKTHTLEHCPKVSDGKGDDYGYAMSRDLLGAKATTVPKAKPLVFDSVILSRNAVGGPWLLPDPGRHAGKNLIAYADGHEKIVVNPGVGK